MNARAIPVTIPLLNPNEPEALLADLYVAEGQALQAGDLICSLETTKGAGEVTAEAAGYVAGLSFHKGDLVPAGAVLCYLAPAPDWNPAAENPATSPQGARRTEKTPAGSGDLPQGLRITEPALAYARSQGIDLAGLPVGPLVTKGMLKGLTAPATKEADTAAPAGRPVLDPNGILLYGAGGHGKMLTALLQLQGNYRILGFIDDGLAPGAQVMGLPVLGGSGELARLYQRGIRLAANAVGGIANVEVRIRVFERLAQAGFACPALFHPRALVEPGAMVDAGAQIMAMAYVGSEAQVGFGAIVNTGAIVSHDCRVGEYVAISPGAVLAGGVQVGRAALIGMGVTVNFGVKVGAKARIGNGATVKADVPENTIVRAGTIWPER